MVKKKLPPPADVKIYTGNDNLTIQWFVYYTDHSTSPPKRKRFYGNINKFKTIAERRAAAEILRQKIILQLAGTVSEIRAEVTGLLAAHTKYLRKKTTQSYTSKIKYFILYLESKGIRSILDITEEIANDFIQHIVETRSIGAVTYNHFLKTCSRVIAHGLPENVPNPFRRIKRRTQASISARHFQALQIKRIKNALLEHDPQLWFFCQFMYYCGFRPNEIRLLKVSDILTSEKRIIIRSSSAKNKKQRYKNVPDVFWPQIEAFLEKHEYKESYYLFSHHSAPGINPLGINYFSRKHQDMLKKIGIDTDVYKLYSWRHYSAVQLAQKGVSTREIMEHLGHSSESITEIYLKGFGITRGSIIITNFPEI